MVWTPSQSGEFTVKSVALELAKASSPFQIDAIKGIWCGMVPPRIEISLWMALMGKINTRQRLNHIGILPIPDSNCIFCDSELERAVITSSLIVLLLGILGAGGSTSGMSSGPLHRI